MSTSNTKITLKGNPVKINGKALSVGEQIPLVQLSDNGLQDCSLEQYLGSPIVILSVPSVDTPVCQTEIREFNQKVNELPSGVKIIAVSRDLPFAQSRWCAAQGIEAVSVLSDYKYRVFGEAFGVEMPDVGILCRAVFVADESGKIVHVEYVDEVSNEPNYESALAALV